jgi:hypothetical protein
MDFTYRVLEVFVYKDIPKIRIKEGKHENG